MERIKNYKTLAYPEIDRKKEVLKKFLIALSIKTMSSVRTVKHLNRCLPKKR